MIGGMLSIQFTIPVTLHVFPARSEKVKRKLPLPVNRYPVAFIHVTVSLNHVSIAITAPLVVIDGAYSTIAVG